MSIYKYVKEKYSVNTFQECLPFHPALECLNLILFQWHNYHNHLHAKVTSSCLGCDFINVCK